MRKLLLFIGALAAVLGLAAIPAGATSAHRRTKAKTGSLTIVHGIPDLPVDIYVNKKLALAGVTFTKYATVNLPAGHVRVDFKAAGTPRQRTVGARPRARRQGRRQQVARRPPDRVGQADHERLLQQHHQGGEGHRPGDGAPRRRRARRRRLRRRRRGHRRPRQSWSGGGTGPGRRPTPSR